MAKIEFLDFWASWCGPCKIMNPVIEELEKHWGDKVKVTKINVDEDLETPQKYNVMSIPTYIVLKDGEVTDQFSGVTSKELIKMKVGV